MQYKFSPQVSNVSTNQIRDDANRPRNAVMCQQEVRKQVAKLKLNVHIAINTIKEQKKKTRPLCWDTEYLGYF